MKNAIELKTEQTKKLIKRLNYLNYKYQEDISETNPAVINKEIALLEMMQKALEVSRNDYIKMPVNINIRNSRDEEWYFQQMKNWIQRHPTVLNGRSGRSSIYKFALHFFVENIVLEPNNTQLSDLQLADRIKTLTRSKSTSTADFKLDQLEEMTSFMMAMLFKQYDYIPEEITEKGMISYALNSMNEFALNSSIQASEINPNKQLGKTFKLYRDIRQRDKMLVKKINSKLGDIQND